MFLNYNLKALAHHVLQRVPLTGSLQAYGYMDDDPPRGANNITDISVLPA